jgi:cytochrome b6
MKPRELIWITGIMVASRTVGFGVSGYSLAWDQVAFWGSKIVTSNRRELSINLP